MRFDRESWRKLYVAESLEHRLLSVFARGFRDFLLRYAEEDGTLFRSKRPVDDLCRALNADPKEKKLIADAVKDLIRVGYLSHEGDRLWITRFYEAQNAASPEAKRQAAFRERERQREEEERRRKMETAKVQAGQGEPPRNEPGNVTPPSPPNVTGNGGSTVTGNVTPDETRPDETHPPDPGDGGGRADPDLVRRSKLWLEDPNAAQFAASHPEAWPEVVSICSRLHAVFGGRPQYPRNANDPRVRCILARFAEGYGPDELGIAIELAAKDPHIAENRQFQTVQTILRDSAQVDKFLALGEAKSGVRKPNGVIELDLDGNQINAVTH